MDTRLKLTEEQVNEVKRLTANGTKDFHKAYDYVSTIIADNPDVDDDTKVWFQRAAEVNRNDEKSAANNFIRTVSGFGRRWDGKSPDGLQDTSDGIGKLIVGGIMEDGKIPPVTELVRKDVQQALEDGNQSIGGWGGAFYYWDLPITEDGKTVGDLILEDPEEYEKFVAVNAAALNRTVGSELGQLFDFSESGNEVLDLIGFGFGDVRVPGSVWRDIAGRATSGFATGVYTGPTDRVEGWKYSERSKRWEKQAGTQHFPRIVVADDETALRLNQIRDVRLEKQESSRFFDDQSDQGRNGALQAPLPDAGAPIGSAAWRAAMGEIFDRHQVSDDSVGLPQRDAAPPFEEGEGQRVLSPQIERRRELASTSIQFPFASDEAESAAMREAEMAKVFDRMTDAPRQHSEKPVILKSRPSSLQEPLVNPPRRGLVDADALFRRAGIESLFAPEPYGGYRGGQRDQRNAAIDKAIGIMGFKDSRDIGGFVFDLNDPQAQPGLRRQLAARLRKSYG